MSNHGLPNEFTPCEEYGGYIIAMNNGWYHAFSRFSLKQVDKVSANTRAKVRENLNQRAQEAGGGIGSGDIHLADGYVFRWMLQGDRSPEIYGWVERDHSITHKAGFWRTADVDEACRRACASYGLKEKA